MQGECLRDLSAQEVGKEPVHKDVSTLHTATTKDPEDLGAAPQDLAYQDVGAPRQNLRCPGPRKSLVRSSLSGSKTNTGCSSFQDEQQCASP